MINFYFRKEVWTKKNCLSTHRFYGDHQFTDAHNQKKSNSEKNVTLCDKFYLSQLVDWHRFIFYFLFFVLSHTSYYYLYAPYLTYNDITYTYVVYEYTQKFKRSHYFVCL